MPSKHANGLIPKEEIPVLLTIFNRPDKIGAVMDNLRQIKPKLLFIAADGPRKDVQQDFEKCRLARQEATSVDWECDIKTRFLDENLGCDPAVSSALDWFFQQVEFGIIIEDDCLVHPHFFAFCGELFARYSEDERIMQISALSPYARREHLFDYHFSPVFRCSGGWGTWRRAWKHFTDNMNNYGNDEMLEILKASHLDYYECIFRYKRLMAYNRGSIMVNRNGSLLLQRWGHWDFQWELACSAQNGLSIVPERNLMLNIGFDENSTNTKLITPVFDSLEFQPLRFPLRHPAFVYADSRPERSLQRKIYRSLPRKSRFMYLLRRALGAIYYLRERMP